MLIPVTVDVDKSTGSAKRPREIEEDDVPYVPHKQNKAVHKTAETNKSSKGNHKIKKKAARLKDMDTPVINASGNDPANLERGSSKRRTAKRKENSGSAGIAL